MQTTETQRHRASTEKPPRRLHTPIEVWVLNCLSQRLATTPAGMAQLFYGSKVCSKRRPITQALMRLWTRGEVEPRSQNGIGPHTPFILTSAISAASCSVFLFSLCCLCASVSLW